MSSLQLTGGDFDLRGDCQKVNADPKGSAIASTERMTRKRIMNCFGNHVFLHTNCHLLCNEIFVLVGCSDDAISISLFSILIDSTLP